MKRNIRLIVSYDGTRYYGWEKQKTTDMTIQGKLEALLTKMTGSLEPVTVIGAGRTDAGVHARAMVCNAFLKTDLQPEEIHQYVNHYLPDDICVLDVKEAGERFHSRFNALSKTYCYTCYYGNAKPIFDRKYVYVLDERPNLEAMKLAASYLIGTKDFKSFCGNPKMKKSTVRTIDWISIQEENDYIRFTYHGDGFLQHMIRILTGTLLEVGWGKRTVESIPSLIEAKERAQAGFTVPALGLCLESIDYH